jgi:2-dehydro-3-deoxyphosphogalactonate aldolase
MISAVGGISDKNFAEYTKAGIHAFGLGTSLFKPGMTVADVAARARASVDAYVLCMG